MVTAQGRNGLRGEGEGSATIRRCPPVDSARRIADPMSDMRQKSSVKVLSKWQVGAHQVVTRSQVACHSQRTGGDHAGVPCCPRAADDRGAHAPCAYPSTPVDHMDPVNRPYQGAPGCPSYPSRLFCRRWWQRPPTPSPRAEGRYPRRRPPRRSRAFATSTRNRARRRAGSPQDLHPARHRLAQGHQRQCAPRRPHG